MLHLKATFLLRDKGQDNNNVYIINISPQYFIRSIIGEICVPIAMELLQCVHTTIIMKQMFSAVNGFIFLVLSGKES